jgi:hypothetical protein
MNAKYSTETRDVPVSASWERAATSGGSALGIPEEALASSAATPHYIAARGFGQMFGLHPIPAILTLAVDAMLFGGTIVSGGAIWPLALGVAAVLGFVTYRAQMRFYNDDSEAAMIKAVSISLLSAIPTSLPGFLTVPSAVVGVVHTLRRKG